MFGSNVLEIVIGLIFVYLLISLLVTTLNEMIATLFSFRARMLAKAIRKMLNDDRKEVFFKAFYAHPFIKYLGENQYFHRPSYISGEVFAKTMVEIIKSQTNQPKNLQLMKSALSQEMGNSETKKLLCSLMEDSQGNFQQVKAKLEAKLNELIANTTQEKIADFREVLAEVKEDVQTDLSQFQKNLEDWFNKTMERTSEWYGRKAKINTFLIGFSIAVFFHADSFSIIQKLSRDAQARKELVEMAGNYTQKLEENSKSVNEKSLDKAAEVSSEDEKLWKTADSLRNQINQIVKEDLRAADTVLGMGWTKSKIDAFWQGFNWIFCILGWLLTAVATSLGSSFWFDVLKQFIQLRNAVKK